MATMGAEELRSRGAEDHGRGAAASARARGRGAGAPREGGARRGHGGSVEAGRGVIRLKRIYNFCLLHASFV